MRDLSSSVVGKFNGYNIIGVEFSKDFVQLI